jgi:hypothetical protein
VPVVPIDPARDEPPEPTHAGPPHICLVCGYSLNGMPREALCPECANPVARSLRGNMLEYADRRYVTSLLHGATIVVVGLGLATLLMVSTPPSITFRESSPAFWVRGGTLAGHVADFLAAGLALLGWWMLSAPDPVQREIGADLRARRLLRACLVVVMLGTLAGLMTVLTPAISNSEFGLIAGKLSFDSSQPWTPVLIAALLVWALLSAVKVASFFLGLLYLRALSARIPSPRAHRETTRLMWLVPLLATVGLAAFCLGPVIANLLYIAAIVRLRSDISAVLRRMPDTAAVSREPPASR